MKPAPHPTYRPLNTYTKLVRAADSVTARITRPMTEAGLTISQFGVLEALFHKGPLCQRDIAAKILKSSGNLTLVIDNLQKQGLVTRERTSEDRRYLTISLTESGRKLIGEIFARVEEAIVRELGVLSAAEQDILGGLCKKLGIREGGQTPSS